MYSIENKQFSSAGIWLSIAETINSGIYIIYTLWHKRLTVENFDEFDESKLHHQNFPCQYFAHKNVSTFTYNL